jgi:hypothetical protein
MIHKRRSSFMRLALALVLLGLSLHVASPAHAQATPNPSASARNYVDNQTFRGQAFFKDNHVWVYTTTFAETFGMPPENIEPNLSGIEAAAFRVEERSYPMCGLGGKAENCKDEYRCVTDIYVDERKHPLPWATDQQMDWLSDYSSLRWLSTSSESAVMPKIPSNVIPNIALQRRFTLHPFADPQSRREANYFQNGDTPFTDDVNYSPVSIYGYKRSTVAGLTMVSLLYRCNMRNSKKPTITFRLESREQIVSRPLSRFHEFQLPDAFGKKIDERVQARFARDRELYKNLLKMK